MARERSRCTKCTQMLSPHCASLAATTDSSAFLLLLHRRSRLRLEQPLTQPISPRRRGSYGIDAPYAAAFMVALAIVELAIAIATAKVIAFLAFLFVSAIAASYFYNTLRGKFVVWAHIL